LRIGLNALAYAPGRMGGTETYIVQLVRHLPRVAPQHQYVLFVSKEGWPTLGQGSTGMSVVALPVSANARGMRILAEQCVLPFLAKAKGLDVLHSLSFTSPLLAPCPSVTSVLDMGFRRRDQRFSRPTVWAFELLVPVVVRRSAHILTLSQYARHDILSSLSVHPGKVSAVHLAPDRELYREVQASEEEQMECLARYGISKPYLLSVAFSHPHKNLDGLVRAYASLVQKHRSEHQLVLVGGARSAHDALVGLVRELGLRERVVLTGYVPDRDLALLYAMADVFVFPSFYEGFGLPPLEAMACGTPVVCSNASSLPEVVGDAAVQVDPHSVQELELGILSVLADEELRCTLVQKGLERVKEFSWEKTAQGTLAVYDQVVTQVSVR
jgi:alpha-1,3-rhamnosyl/mannosyltransferase